MARVPLAVTVAPRTALIQPTGFKGYDVCTNSYVGCEFGCRYCYVRFFIKDPEHDWGDFLRVRDHIRDKFPKELERGYFRIPNGKRVVEVEKDGEKTLKNQTIYRNLPHEKARLVIGTMTDPYQPQERKWRLTRKILAHLLQMPNQLSKVGIFTRSPIVLDDLRLIQRLPRKRVHFTITPYTPEVLHRIEPIAIRTDRRFDTVKKLKEGGVRMHVNVAPALPIISDSFTDDFARQLAEIKVDEFFVDPMQAYKESFEALETAMHGHKDWKAVRTAMQDAEAFQAWKDTYRDAWIKAWKKVQHLSPNTLPIWSDHVHHVWVDMRNGQQMDFKLYGDDLTHYKK